ncbi:energy transducer TonB [Pontibacter sp. G13]|uniref:energy transducer TonB n=1 Tax=Pontibacter sp. G13 TaxID=3074898 RepID=UPI00288AB16B|nr:energy transducer TonB [Pontibacter sp. G13]WNJ18144.1 energy transducer TonB [Pontibacter sp. G13]
MIRFSLLLLMTSFAFSTFAQNKDEGDKSSPVSSLESLSEESQIYEIVEEPAEFPGGMSAMIGFIQENLQYPPDARRMGIEGKVYLSFIVEKDGSLSDVKVLRSVCESIDTESIRLVKSMPRWKPGTQRGKRVRVKFVLPLGFKLS